MTVGYLLLVVLFFILAGAALDITRLWQIGMVGTGYVVLRVIARFAGGWLGAKLGGSPTNEAPWFGPALLPQAGVAVGMALVAATEFPEIADTVLTLTIGATVVFELVGPVATILALHTVNRAEQG